MLQHYGDYQRERGWGEVKEGKGNGDEGDLTLSDEYTIRYIDDVLQNCKLETYVILLTNVIPINSTKFFLNKKIVVLKIPTKINEAL